MDESSRLNRLFWDERAPIHAASPDYGLDRFIADPSYIGDVAFASDLLVSGQFDLVYTGIGALCWLPDIQRWAHTVADHLLSGGRLFVSEGHSMMWALDEGLSDGSLVVRYPYFQTRDPIEDDEPGTYVQTDADSSTRPVTHGITASARSSVPCSMRVWS